MNPKNLAAMTDEQIRDTALRFKRFAENWNVAGTQSALKMFLACGMDMAMHRLDIDHVPDEEWEAFVARVAAI